MCGKKNYTLFSIYSIRSARGFAKPFGKFCVTIALMFIPYKINELTPLHFVEEPSDYLRGEDKTKQMT